MLFVGGVVLGVRGMREQPIQSPARPIAPGPRSPLTLQAVEDEWRTLHDPLLHAADGPASPKQAKPSASTPPPDELSLALAKLRTLFPDPPYAWEDELENVCSIPSAFGCLQTGTRLKRRGVVSVLKNAFEGLNRSDATEYLIILFDVLKLAPMERRLDLVPAAVAAEKRAREEYDLAKARHQRRASEVENKYQLEVDLAKAKHAQWREFGIYGIASGLGLLVVVSLFLAFLSVERHTRALDALLQRSVPRGGGD
ncbi:MAG TPA: hypothetical protein VG937_24075 [Polyangiaceae bacterium]|nr:hypothetical protein [Polyangiaceae bacterium]